MRDVKLVLALSAAVITLSGCSGSEESEDGLVENSLGVPAQASTDTSAPGVNTVPTETAADSTAYTIRAVAGHESGLVKLVSIDDTIAVGKRDGVTVQYSGTDEERFPGTTPGILYNCDGLLDRKDCDVFGTVTYRQPGTYSYTVTYDVMDAAGNPAVQVTRTVRCAMGPPIRSTTA